MLGYVDALADSARLADVRKIADYGIACFRHRKLAFAGAIGTFAQKGPALPCVGRLSQNIANCANTVALAVLIIGVCLLICREGEGAQLTTESLEPTSKSVQPTKYARSWQDPAWASFIVALLAFIVSIYYGSATKSDSTRTLTLERQPVLTGVCDVRTHAHPTYTLSLMTQSNNYQMILGAGDSATQGDHQISECVYSNLGRLPLLHVVIHLRVQFHGANTPLTGPGEKFLSEEIAAISVGQPVVIWIRNLDRCDTMGVHDSPRVSLEVPPDDKFPNYILPGWLDNGGTTLGPLLPQSCPKKA